MVEVFAASRFDDGHLGLYDAAAFLGVPWHLVDDGVMADLSGTVSPQGVVAVCRHVDVPLDEVTASRPRLVTICANVRDPGNAGTVIRCADAAGAAAVVLAGTSVDPYNGKAVRASAGSLFHVPIVTEVSVAEAVGQLRAAGMTVLAADGDGDLSLDTALDTAMLSRPTAWLFGNEAWGLPAADRELADHVVRVPIYGQAESLNLATAAAVCLYASARAQRSSGADAD